MAPGREDHLHRDQLLSRRAGASQLGWALVMQAPRGTAGGLHLALSRRAMLSAHVHVEADHRTVHDEPEGAKGAAGREPSGVTVGDLLQNGRKVGLAEV